MELLLHILIFANDRSVIIASGVCREWKEAICFGVQELSLSWCKQNMNNLILSTVPKFTRLQSLNLHQQEIHLNDQAVEMVAKHCHDLHALDLSSNTRLPDKALQAIDLSRSTQLTDKALEALAHGCNLLEKLNISGCSKVTDSGLIILSEKCNKLRHLNLWGCFNAVTDRSLLALAHNNRGLQFLNLGWCPNITDFGVTGLAKCCPELKALDLYYCGWISDKCLLTLAQNCCGLQFLNLGLCQITDVGVTGLAKRCPELRAVSLCGCMLITDQSVIALATYCHHLRKLGLLFCINITDTAMCSLVNSSVRRSVKQNVKDKGNTNSDRIPDASHDYMKPDLNDQEAYGLVLLNISNCTSLTAPAVQALCDTFPALHTCPDRSSLIITGCLNLTSVHCVCNVEVPENRESKLVFFFYSEESPFYKDFF